MTLAEQQQQRDKQQLDKHLATLIKYMPDAAKVMKEFIGKHDLETSLAAINICIAALTEYKQRTAAQRSAA